MFAAPLIPPRTSVSSSRPEQSYVGIHLKSKTYPLQLRNPSLSESDVSALQSLLSNPLNTARDNPSSKQTNGHRSSGGPTIDEMRASIEKMLADADQPYPTRVNFVVVDLSDASDDGLVVGKVVGLSGFGAIHTINGKRVGDVGVMLQPEARGRGFAAEAMRMSVEWGFEFGSLDTITVGMEEGNAEMIKVMDALGWIGVRRARDDGVDERVYSVDKVDWKGW